MLLKGAYCVGEHFVDPQCVHVTDKRSYFSSKTYVVGSQMNRLNGGSFEHPKRMLKIIGQKILQFYAEICC